MTQLTIAGLAEQLGISKAAVSYALNGRPGVSATTRAKVLAHAAEVGWYASSSARALSAARTETVGIVLVREREELGAEPFYLSVLSGIEAVLGERELNLMLRIVAPVPRTVPPAAGRPAWPVRVAPPAVGSATVGPLAAVPRRDLAVYQRWAGERRVDGVLLFDEVDDDPRYPLLTRLGLPFVSVGGTVPPAPGSAAATANQGADVATLLAALRERGHRRIAYVSGPPELTHERRRSEALAQQADAGGMTLRTSASDYTAQDASAATTALMAGVRPGSADFPTAIIYGNDLMAVGGMAALTALRLDVPGQVSVLSWDDSILCQFGTPALAALARNIPDMGRHAARLLLHLIEGGVGENVALPPGVLQLRTSLGPATS